MMLNIPRYENGEKWWNKDDHGYDIDVISFVKEINSVDDFINSYETEMHLEKIEEYFNIIDEINKLQIENTIHIKFYVGRLKDFKNHFNLITKEMPFHIKEIYSEKLKPLTEELKKVIRLNRIFVINNRDEIINRTNEIINGFINKKKEARALANKKYYEKNKKLFNSIAKPVKTEEQKKEAQAKAKRKYYQSKKELLKQLELLQSQII